MRAWATFKSKWRQLGDSRHAASHCFTKHEPGQRSVYRSLCGDYVIRSGIGSTRSAPIPGLRCARCDQAEMALYGADESVD